MKACASHNRIYRVVWSRARSVWMVVSELARGLGKGGGRGKRSRRGLLLLVPFLLCSSLAVAAPTGGQVIAGTGSISQSGATTTIKQSSQNLSLSWKSFNVAATETVNFKQPNNSALAVNRIHDTNGSQIMGHLNANGNIYLINPNGILFGSTAEVNVGGLVASTLDTADNSRFAGAGQGTIVNEGTINAQRYVALLGNSVTNRGVVTATLGTVAMGAGSDVSLTFSGNSLVKIQVNKSVIDSLVANHGLIKADGGMVVMNAGARDTLLASVVNNDGVVQAQTVSDKDGTITLLGGMAAGTVNVGGTLDASAPSGGNGGAIETSAAHVHVADNAKVTTKAAGGQSGTWLIDPQDYTIAASGGDITGSALTTNLGNGNVTIQSSSGGTSGSGNINVNDTVSWSANTLTLTAAKDIDINAVMSATGSASLALNPATTNGSDSAVSGGTVNAGLNGGGFTGRVDFSGTGSLSIGGTAYTVISSMTGLQGMTTSGHYVLGANLTDTTTTGSGFTPIGTSSSGFTGTFDGLGHTITDFYINSSSGINIGLFGYVGSGGSMRNVGLVGGSVTGSSNVVGGLVGYNNGGTISNAYTTGSVSTSNSNGVVDGGLVGQNSGTITNAYATGSVSGYNNVGGLVGYNVSTLSKAYATGRVSGGLNAGGLVGVNTGTIGNSYATGRVSGSTYVGGLVARNDGGTVSNSYAIGNVSGTTYVGGLVGYINSGTITNSYWDTTTSGQSTSAGGTGESTTNMEALSTFSGAGWSITGSGGGSSTWRIYDGQSYPLLDTFLTQLTITAKDASKTYDGSSYSGGNGVSDSVTTDSTLLGSASYSGTSQGAANAGSYTIAPSGFYSTSQSGYDVSYANGTLTVNKASLSVSGITASNKTYDGTTAATLSGTASLSGVISGDTVTLGGTGSGAFADKNVGTGKSVTISGYSISGTSASNYSLSQPSGVTANITAKALTISGITASNKTYDGTTAATLSTSDVTYTGLVSGDVVSVNSTGTFADKNVGTDKTVALTSSYSGSDVGNYSITDQASAMANITMAPLTVTANDASKTYDGSAYSGGNGVNYSGFVNNEDSSVLGGTLAYGGGSQGAVVVGSYVIVPSGLTSSNYAITFNDGTLTVNIMATASQEASNANTVAQSVMSRPMVTPMQSQTSVGENAFSPQPASGQSGSGSVSPSGGAIAPTPVGQMTTSPDLVSGTFIVSGGVNAGSTVGAGGILFTTPPASTGASQGK